MFVVSDGAHDVERCSNSWENSDNERAFRDSFVRSFTTSANTKHVSVSGKPIIRRHFKPISLNLFGLDQGWQTILRTLAQIAPLRPALFTTRRYCWTYRYVHPLIGNGA